MSQPQIIDLLHRASQLVENAYVTAAPDDGLTPRQLMALRFIASHPGCSQTDVVDNTGIDRSTLADILRRVLKRGLIERKRTKEDMRAYTINLSVPGERVLAAAEKTAKMTERGVMSKIAAPKQAALTAALTDLIAALEDAEAKKAA
ncbi:MAG: MarR family winged helix-turn-helix transcriptional regulator [Betaproteobacteria bacterium]